MKKQYTGIYGIIIYDNNIALIRKKCGAYMGKLDLPGGGIEHGETPIECLKREVYEEAGIKIYNVKLIDIISNKVVWNYKDTYEDLHHIGAIYKVNDIIKDQLKESPDGLDSLGCNWYEINKLKEEELSPFAYYAIKWLKNEYK